MSNITDQELTAEEMRGCWGGTLKGYEKMTVSAKTVPVSWRNPGLYPCFCQMPVTPNEEA